MKRPVYILTLFAGCMFALIGCSPEATLPATNTPTTLATNTEKPPLPTATTLPSPTSTQIPIKKGLIAFFTENGIMLINADGTDDAVLISAHPTNDSKPSWSPDGSQIVFESMRDNVESEEIMDIYIMNSDGSRLTRITNTDSWNTQPDWSPDGDRIALVSDSQEPGNIDIYVLDLKSRDFIRVTDDPGLDIHPSWSPDGLYITFASDRDGTGNIYTVEVNTGETRQLTRESGGNDNPDWSPDGTKILFVSNRDDGDFEIYMMDTDGKNQSRLTNSQGFDDDPAWSPDGNFFAYTHEESGDGVIYVMDLSKSESIPLFKNPGYYSGYPDWSPVDVAISLNPMFGPPFCLRDTDIDFEPDTVTNTFFTNDLFPYVAFPYRNMKSNVSWGYTFDYENSNMNMMNVAFSWKDGETGWFISSPSGATLSMVGPGKMTIELYIEDELVQKIECNILEP